MTLCVIWQRDRDGERIAKRVGQCLLRGYKHCAGWFLAEGRERRGANGWRPKGLGAQSGHQAIETAIKASKKINTPPAMGMMNGIDGTMEATTSSSASWLAAWGVGADMVILSVQHK